MRRLLVFALALASVPVASHAQAFSIYFTSNNTRFSNVENGQSYSPNTSTYSALFTNTWPAQFGGGVTINGVKSGPVRLGMDFRGSTNHSNNGADTAMAGPRLAVRLPLIHIKPYVAAEGGYVATRTTGTVTTANAGGTVVTTTSPTLTNQYAAWEIFGGVDVPIIPHLDFRAVEIGGGRGYLANSGIQNISFSNSNTQISLFSIDTGIVVHF